MEQGRMGPGLNWGMREQLFPSERVVPPIFDALKESLTNVCGKC